MDISKSYIRRDRTLQLVRQDSKPLTLMGRFSCKNEESEDLENVVDVDKDLERYQKDTLRKIKPQHVYNIGIFES